MIFRLLYVCNFKRINLYLVIMPLKVTPVPIPNTMVKLQRADGTARATVWESRLLLGQLKIKDVYL